VVQQNSSQQPPDSIKCNARAGPPSQPPHRAHTHLEAFGDHAQHEGCVQQLIIQRAVCGDQGDASRLLIAPSGCLHRITHAQQLG
jgi:hypothetical protein